jgi:hypothetical protein
VNLSAVSTRTASSKVVWIGLRVKSGTSSSPR